MNVIFVFDPIRISAQNFPGFDWENPVWSSFEDWVMGWENETGRMDYKFFWGRMLSAVAKSQKKQPELARRA